MAQYEDANKCFTPVEHSHPITLNGSVSADTISSGVISSVHFNLHNELVKLYQEVGKSNHMTKREVWAFQLDILREIGYLNR